MRGYQFLTYWLLALARLFPVTSAEEAGTDLSRPERFLQAGMTTVTGYLMIWVTNEQPPQSPTSSQPSSSEPPVQLQLSRVVFANGTSSTATTFVEVANSTITDVSQLPSQLNHGSQVSVTGQLSLDDDGVAHITVNSLANIVAATAAADYLSAPLQGAYTVLYTRIILGGACAPKKQPTLPVFLGQNTVSAIDVNGTSGVWQTVNATWQSCSFGSIWVDPASKYQEYTTGTTFSANIPPSPTCPPDTSSVLNRCPSASWLDLIRQYAEGQAQLNFPGFSFGYHTIAFPNMNCTWIGMATVRCQNSSSPPACYAFLNGDYGKDAAVTIHEWGHNLNNAHGGLWLPSTTAPNAYYQQYAEATTSMASLGLYSITVGSNGELKGTAQPPGQGVAQCYNVVEQARLGWTLPWVLDNSSLLVGSAFRTTLPALSNTTNTGLQFNVETWNLDQPYPALPTERVYMSYLLAEGGWSKLSSPYSNSVNVYRHGARLWTDYVNSAWVAAVPGGGSHVVTPTPAQLAPYLRLDVISTDPTVSKSAVVQVCRYAAGGDPSTCPSTATANISTLFTAYASTNFGKAAAAPALAVIPMAVSVDYLRVLHDKYCYTYNLQAPAPDKVPRGASFALMTQCPATFGNCSNFFSRMTLTLFYGANLNYSFPLNASMCDASGLLCSAAANKINVINPAGVATPVNATYATLCFNNLPAALSPSPSPSPALVKSQAAGASIAGAASASAPLKKRKKRLRVHSVVASVKAQAAASAPTSVTMNPVYIQSSPVAGQRRARSAGGGSSGGQGVI